MGFLDKLFGRSTTYSVNPIRDTLYGDIPIEMWPPDGVGLVIPWNYFAEARKELTDGRSDAAIALWSKILSEPDLESRRYLQAWDALRQHGVNPPDDIAKQVLGIVVEVGLPNGVDLLAAYADSSCSVYQLNSCRLLLRNPDIDVENSMHIVNGDIVWAGKQTGFINAYLTR